MLSTQAPFWSPNYTSYHAQWTVSAWFGLYYDWATLGGLERVHARVPESVGDLWHKQNTAIWLELHDFMQQTQNLVLACNPTIRTRNMLGSTQLVILYAVSSFSVLCTPSVVCICVLCIIPVVGGCACREASGFTRVNCQIGQLKKWHL